MISVPEQKEQVTCPVCNKTFFFNEESCYYIKGGWTCSWECFLNALKSRQLNANESITKDIAPVEKLNVQPLNETKKINLWEQPIKKRGRPKKNVN